MEEEGNEQASRSRVLMPLLRRCVNLKPYNAEPAARTLVAFAWERSGRCFRSKSTKITLLAQVGRTLPLSGWRHSEAWHCSRNLYGFRGRGVPWKVGVQDLANAFCSVVAH